MKIAMCNEMFSGWSLARQFEYIAQCGFDGIELAPFTVASDLSYADPVTQDIRKIGVRPRKAITKLSADYGIPVSGLHWLLAKTQGYHITSPEKRIRDKTARYLKEIIRFCHDVGGTYIVFGSPQQRSILPTVSMNDAYSYAQDLLETLLPTLEEANVILALEPLSPFETNFIQTADDARYLIEKLGCPKQLAIHLDCKAMFGSEKSTIPMVLRDPRLRPYLKTFHANDPNLRGPGLGALDFRPIMEALSDIRFYGWIAVEPFDYTPDAEIVAQSSIDYLRRFV